MSNDQFLSFFRMTRESFSKLACVISNYPIFYNDSHNPQVSPILQLATCLYFLGAYGGSTVKGAAQLGIGEGTAHLYCQHCMIALVRISPQYIRWPVPGSLEFQTILKDIERESGCPGCIGFLDGTDIVLQYSPSFHGESYFNRKKGYGLNVQGICDSHGRFTYIASGFPGSVEDATVFGGSSFFQRPNLYFSQPKEYVLTDKAYRVTG